MDFNDVAPGGEAFGGDVKAVDAEGQVLQNEVSVGGNLEFALEAVALAEKFAAGGKRGTFGIADFEVEFATKALRARGDRRGEAEEASQGKEADLLRFCVHFQKKYAIPGVSI